jgi:hypothetical protein
VFIDHAAMHAVAVDLLDKDKASGWATDRPGGSSADGYVEVRDLVV